MARTTMPTQITPLMLSHRVTSFDTPARERARRAAPTTRIRTRNTFAKPTYAESGFPKIVIVPPGPIVLSSPHVQQAVALRAPRPGHHAHPLRDHDGLPRGPEVVRRLRG